MAIDATFMAALMKIPYFAKLSEENGDAWLRDLFQSLEVESFDFSPFENIVPKYDLNAPEIDLGIDNLIVDAAQTADDAGRADKDDVDESGSFARQSNDEIEQTQAAIAAKHSVQEKSEKASNDGSAGDGHLPDFANNRFVLRGGGPTDWDRQQKWQIMQTEPEYGTFKLEEPGAVALNGVYDLLKLSDGNDKIYTIAGQHGSGTTVVNAGDGTDTLFLTTGGLKANLAGVSNFGGKVELRGVENVIGSDGDDTINGNAADNKLVGRGGNDKIDGGSGDDEIIGGGGKNVLNGGGGSDDITGGGGVDIINGGGGDDDIKGGGGDDDISGGDGDDQINGAAGDDKADGGGGSDEIDGGDGDDEIDGGAGDDTIDAGDGTDVVNGDAGKDEIDGGEGDDEIDGGADDDELNGDAGNDTIDGGDGADKLDGGEGDDTLNGDDGNDTIVGAAGTDTISGGDGDDNIDGGAVNDVILGGIGKDVLKGGAGNDTITGGVGGDTITGGDGSDVYVYTDVTDSGITADTFDIITDFDVANDKFDLTALLANDAFDFIAAEGGAFTGGSDNPEVKWDKTGGKTIIEIDIDGNGVADMQIELDDELDLTAGNFNL